MPREVHLVRFHRVVGAEHLPHHLPDQRHRHRRGVVDDLLGDRPCSGQQLVRRHHLADEPAFQRLVGREHAARIRPLQRLRDADQARQEPARRRLRHDAAAREHEAEARIGRGDADVHRQLHGHADADGRPVHRGDHGFQALEDAQGDAPAAVAHEVVGVIHRAVRLGRRRAAARGAVERVAARGEVGARAKAAPCAGDDDGADAVVLVGPIERVDQLRLHRAGEGVELVRPVQRDGEDVVGNVIENGFIGHARLPRVLLWADDGRHLVWPALLHAGSRQVNARRRQGGPRPPRPPLSARREDATTPQRGHGGIGRRKGLKIPRFARTVPVRFRLPAPSVPSARVPPGWALGLGMFLGVFDARQSS